MQQRKKSDVTPRTPHDAPVLLLLTRYTIKHIPSPALLFSIGYHRVKGLSAHGAARHCYADVALEGLTVLAQVFGSLLVERVGRVGLEEEELRLSV